MGQIKAFLPYLIAAGIGFVISLLSGAVGGVGFLTILWKSFLTAAIWGLGAWGLHLLLKALLPDVAKALEGETDAASAEGEDESPNTGKHLNLSTHEGAEDGPGLEEPPVRSMPMRDPLEGVSVPLSAPPSSKPAPVAAPKAPRPGDPNASFPQEEKVLAKAVRSVMNQ